MGRKVDCSFVSPSLQCLYIVKITHKNWDYEFVLVTKEQFLVYSMVYQEKNKTKKNRKTVSNGRGERLYFFPGPGGRGERDPVRTKAAILIRVLQRNRAIRIYIQKEIYYETLAHTVRETDKSQDLWLAS